MISINELLELLEQYTTHANALRICTNGMPHNRTFDLTKFKKQREMLDNLISKMEGK